MKINKLFFYQNSKNIFISFFLLCFLTQIIFQFKTEHLKPNVHIVPPVPNKTLVKALSLGDEEFYFRILALKIQNAGDTFGRFTPLKNYNYEKLYQWFTLLDSLNSDSRMMPSIASYYYSQTQHEPDTIHIVRYLDERASIDVDKHWWWLVQAINIANNILKNKELALELAYKLSKNEAKKAPLWTKQMPAFIYEQMGQDCEAFFIINQILQDHESGKRVVKEDEMNFMRHFISTRLSQLKQKKFDPRKCKKKS